MKEHLTTVLLADDHTMFREGLAKLLTTYGGLEVVGETTNDEGAVALARQVKPDVVIMQVQVPFEKAEESLDQMRALSPTPKVVIITMFEDPSSGYRWKKTGEFSYTPSIITAILGIRSEHAEGPQRGYGDVAPKRGIRDLKW